MKRTKRILTLVLAVACIVSAAAFSVSANSNGEAPPITQGETATSTFSQQIPQQVAEIQEDISLSDANRIEAILGLLFEAKRDQNANPTLGDFDFSIFWDPQSSHQNNLTYFERSVKAVKETFSIFDICPLNTHTDLTYNSISITDNTAEVSVYEWFGYTYDITNGCNSGETPIESGTGIPYEISMKKLNSAWLVTNIEFYDESTDKLKDLSVNLDSFIQARYEAATVCEPSVLLAGMTDMEIEEMKQSLEANGVSFLTTVNLDTEKFRTYAYQYEKGKRNPLFPSFVADCQNYASQCVWAGLGGFSTSSMINSASRPMVNANLTSDSSRQWYITIGNGYSGTWTVVGTFAEHVANGSPLKLGLFGSKYSGVANARVGDVIQIRDIDKTSYYHSYVVVRVTGTEGSRKYGDIFVCSHTTDRAETALSLLSYESAFRTIRVNGVVYPTPDSSITPID